MVISHKLGLDEPQANDYYSLMKTTTISQLKSGLCAILKRIEAGESILIVNRDRPVARLEPMTNVDFVDEEDRLLHLEQNGVIRRASKSPDVALLELPIPKPIGGAGLLEALIEEREQGR